MSDEIIKIMDYISEQLGVAIDWTQANAVPYAQELSNKYITYEVWTSVFGILFFVFCTVCLCVVARVVYKCRERDDGVWDWGYLSFLACAVAAAMGIITMVIITLEVTDIVTCITFPEKLIIDQIQRLTK